MRLGTWLVCCVGLVAPTALVRAQHSPYQVNNAPVKSTAASAASVPATSLPIQSKAYWPAQPSLSAPVALTVIEITPSPVVAANAAPQAQQSRKDNPLFSLVGHLIGPTQIDGAISESIDQVPIEAAAPVSASYTQNTCAAPIQPPTANANGCCSYRPYVPITSYLAGMHFRLCASSVNNCVRPTSPRSVSSNGPQSRAFDSSFRNGPADARHGLDPVQSFNVNSGTQGHMLPTPTLIPLPSKLQGQP
jgi:hypothetical protein